MEIYDISPIIPKHVSIAYEFALQVSVGIFRYISISIAVFIDMYGYKRQLTDENGELKKMVLWKRSHCSLCSSFLSTKQRFREKLRAI